MPIEMSGSSAPELRGVSQTPDHSFATRPDNSLVDSPQRKEVGESFVFPALDAVDKADARFQDEQDSLHHAGYHFTAWSRDRARGEGLGQQYEGAGGVLRPVSMDSGRQARIDTQTKWAQKVDTIVHAGTGAVKTIFSKY